MTNYCAVVSLSQQQLHHRSGNFEKGTVEQNGKGLFADEPDLMHQNEKKHNNDIIIMNSHIPTAMRWAKSGMVPFSVRQWPVLQSVDLKPPMGRLTDFTTVI